MSRFVVLAAIIAVAQAAVTATTDCTAYNAQIISCKACHGKASTDSACKAASDPAVSTNAKTELANLNIAIGCGLYFQCEEDKAAAVKVAAEEDASSKANAAYTKYKCPTDKAKCMDNDAWCPNWAKDAQCLGNAEWMLVNCQRSCCPVCTAPVVVPVVDNSVCPKSGQESACRVDSKAVGASCAKWAEKDEKTKKSECDTNAAWMVPNCMQSCCPTCQFSTVDLCPTVAAVCSTRHTDADQCASWAKSGQCTANPKWMNVYCAKDCCAVCKPASPAKTIGSPAPLAAPAPAPLAAPAKATATTATASTASTAGRVYLGSAIVGQQAAGAVKQAAGVVYQQGVQQPAFGGYVQGAVAQGAFAMPQQQVQFGR